MPQLNAAFYCFSPLEPASLPGLRTRLTESLRALGLKGTLILAPEGMNGFLAGADEPIRKALALFRSLPGFERLTAKESRSRTVPFKKLSIKLKKEIVTFRVEGLENASAPRVQPEELAEWYREKRQFVILDTRNSYEVKIGTFEGAFDPGLKHFVELKEAAKSFPEEWKSKPVVTFCTGGIRCEKAAPYLAMLGFKEVYQLDGGILNYFEKVGGAHWNGECFVFDERVSLAPDLKPTGATLCVKCQGPNPKHTGTCIHCGESCSLPRSGE